MFHEISKFEIEKIFKDINNEGIDDSFLGVFLFPSNKVNKFGLFEKMMPEKKYRFIISNTDREDQPGTHWWSTLNIYSASKLLFFDSFGIAGLKIS